MLLYLLTRRGFRKQFVTEFQNCNIIFFPVTKLKIRWNKTLFIFCLENYKCQEPMENTPFNWKTRKKKESYSQQVKVIILWTLSCYARNDEVKIIFLCIRMRSVLCLYNIVLPRLTMIILMFLFCPLADDLVLVWILNYGVNKISSLLLIVHWLTPKISMHQTEP